jgi:hypothetical protein
VGEKQVTRLADVRLAFARQPFANRRHRNHCFLFRLSKKKPRRREPAGCRWGRLRFSTAVRRLADATPTPLLPDDPIKAAARYTAKYLIFHLGALPATPNASAHIVAPHTAPGLRIRDTPVVACLVVVGAFRQTCCKSKSLAF